MAPLGPLRAGPFAGVEYVDVKVDGYAETGASLGNIVYADQRYDRMRWSAGAELRGELSAAVIPSLRAAYVWENEGGDTTATSHLAAAQHSMATVTVPLASTERNHVIGAVGLQGAEGNLSYRFGAEARLARGDDDYRVSVGLALAL
ncbi:hypothetical protein GCM10011529_01580 [Polymorphobacter glacialis]|uniref:Autotransporter domain-containing protein n=1 Tax=Sandarakinorhabdus glacialis TaxID=1614636 RepID=A0A917E371_9SPHN|nr:hypothetical protein GCM10011529_01580 [Polymorphobacter glacialis]